MDSPLVSVIIPCFNGEKYICDAIDSVLQQTYPNIEIIVVNDGSTDNSAKIITGYGKKLHVLHQENTGLSAARNAGVKAAKGKYLAFLDCDDYWDQGFVELMSEKLIKDKAAISYCGWQHVGEKTSIPFIPPDYENEDKLHNLLKFASLWPVHGAMVTKKILPDPPFNIEYKSCEDYDLWLRIASSHGISLVPKVLAFYRQHNQGQLTSNQARIGFYNLMVKERFLNEFPEISEKLSPDVIREYCSGAYLRRTYRCFWQSDLEAAHEMFRYAIKRRMITLKHLKYALPALLPYKAFKKLAQIRGLGNSV